MVTAKFLENKGADTETCRIQSGRKQLRATQRTNMHKQTGSKAVKKYNLQDDNANTGYQC